MTSTAETSESSASGKVTQEAVRARAFQLWVRGGKRSGHELEDWLEAERQLRAEAEPAPATLGPAPAARAKKKRASKAKSSATTKPAKPRKRKTRR
jgi:hypothetical protein